MMTVAILMIVFLAAGAGTVMWLNREEKRDEKKKIDFFNDKTKDK